MRQTRNFLFFMLVASSLAGATKQPEPASVLISAQSIAANPGNGKVYIVDAQRPVIWVVDAATNRSKSVAVGAPGNAIAVNPATGIVYVAKASDGKVAVIDGASDQVVSQIAAGPHPYVLAIDPVTGKAYVTNTFSNIVAVIDCPTNTATFLHIGAGDNVAVDTHTSRVFLISYENPRLHILDEKTGTIEKVTVGEHLWGMAVNETTGTVYLTRTGAAELIAFDEKTGGHVAIPTGSIPCAIALDTKNDRVYIANDGDNTVTIVDGRGKHPVTTVTAGLHPQAIALDSETERVYVASTQGNSIAVIDGRTNRVLGTKPAGVHPFGVAVARKGVVYAANLDLETAFTRFSQGALGPWPGTSTPGIPSTPFVMPLPVLYPPLFEPGWQWLSRPQERASPILQET